LAGAPVRFIVIGTLDSRRHHAEFDIEIKAKRVSTLLLLSLNVQRLGHQALRKHPSSSVARRLGSFHEVLFRVAEHRLLVFVLLGDLLQVLDYLVPFRASMVVFAPHALAVLVANNPCLEALAVLLQTLTLLAVAAFRVTLPALARQVAFPRGRSHMRRGSSLFDNWLGDIL